MIYSIDILRYSIIIDLPPLKSKYINLQIG
nr:MAG TPA: hypothetical protein [Caudoviricetes sp.]